MLRCCLGIQQRLSKLLHMEQHLRPSNREKKKIATSFFKKSAYLDGHIEEAVVGPDGIPEPLSCRHRVSRVC
jgi:hypothetical protein